MNTLQALRAARELLSDPSRWSRKHIAVDKKGDPVHETSTDAVAWDAGGAMWKVGASGRDENPVPWRLLREAAQTDHLGRWNGDPARTHEDVLAAFDDCAAARSRPGPATVSSIDLGQNDSWYQCRPWVPKPKLT